MSINALLAVCLLLLNGTPGSDTAAGGRNAAAGWATGHRQEAFDLLIPTAASDAVRMPVCRVTTLRVSGSLDRYEYAVRLVESCPAVDEKGALTEGTFTGELVITDGSPLTDQLARLKLQDPAITTEAAIARIRLRRVPLTPRDARRLVRELLAVTVSPIPPTDIALDRPAYELTSATAITVRVIEITAASRGRGERRIMKLAADLAASHGFGEQQLLYDASFWN